MLCVRVHAQSCLAPCDPIDRHPPGSSVHGIIQARVLEWVAISYSGELPDAGIKPVSLASPAWVGRFFTTAPPGVTCYKDSQWLLHLLPLTISTYFIHIADEFIHNPTHITVSSYCL